MSNAFSRHHLNQRTLQKKQNINPPKETLNRKFKFISVDLIQNHSLPPTLLINQEIQPISQLPSLRYQAHQQMPVQAKEANQYNQEKVERLASNGISENKILKIKHQTQGEETQSRQVQKVFQISPLASPDRNNQLIERQDIVQFQKNQLSQKQPQQQQSQQNQNQQCQMQLQIQGNHSSKQEINYQQQLQNQNQRKPMMQIKSLPQHNNQQQKKLNQEIDDKKQYQFQVPQLNQQQIQFQQPFQTLQRSIITGKTKILERNVALSKDQDLFLQSPKQIVSSQHQGKIIKNDSVNVFKKKILQNDVNTQSMDNLFCFQEIPNSFRSEQSTTFRSVARTILYICHYCNILASEQMINLPCKHIFHTHCFVDFVQIQFKSEQITSLQCFCKSKINQKIIENNCYTQFLNLLQNQAEVIFQNLQLKKYKCKNCIFFCVVDKHYKNETFCLNPSCLIIQKF